MTTASLGRRRVPMMARPSAPSTRWMRVLLAVAIVAGALAATAWGVANDRLLIVAGGAIGVAVVAVGSRAPLALLLIYVALMPWENAGPPGGAGTVVKLIGLAFGIAYVINRGSRLRLDAVGPWVWGFVVWVCASLLWNAHPANSVDEVLTLVQLFVVTLLVADLVLDRPEAAGTLMWTYVASATITSFIGIYMYATQNSSLPDGRAEAFIGQSAPQFAAILLPAAIMLTWRSLHRPAPWAVGGAIVVNLAIVLSATRSAWVAIAVAIALGLLPRLETGRRFALIAGAAALALAMLFTPGVGDLLTERLGTAIESGGTGRTAIWAVGLNVVPEHPMIGIGYNAFPSIVNPENVRATVLPVQTDVLDFPTGPHNIVIGVLVELGVVGLILLLGVGRSLLAGRGRTEASILARAVMIGFATQALFLGILNLKQVWFFGAVALGLAASERLLARDDGALDSVPVDGGIAPSDPSLAAIAGRAATSAVAARGANAARPADGTGAATIELGPPAATPPSPKARPAAAAKPTRPKATKAGTSGSKPKATTSKPKTKTAPPIEEPDPTLGPEDADPMASITDDTKVATRRAPSVIQLPGETPARRKRTNEVIELPAPAPASPPPSEDEDR